MPKINFSFECIKSFGGKKKMHKAFDVPEGIDPMEWMDLQDHSSFMHDNDIFIIVDYWITPEKATKGNIHNKVATIIKALNISEQYKIDLLAVYASIAKTIKGNEYERVLQTIETASVATKAVINTLDNLSNFQKSLEGKSLEELQEMKENRGDNRQKGLL